MEIFVKAPHALFSFHIPWIRILRLVDYFYAFFIFWGGKGRVESLNNNKHIHQGWTGDVFLQSKAGKGQKSIHLRGKEHSVHTLNDIDVKWLESYVTAEKTLICIALSEVRQIYFAPRLRIYMQGVHPWYSPTSILWKRLEKEICFSLPLIGWTDWSIAVRGKGQHWITFLSS